MIMLLAIPICGFLWAYGGADNTSKNWRRLGVPAIIFVFAYIQAYFEGKWLVGAIQALEILFLWGALTIGYGVPDSTDDGSPLGRFWFGIVKKANETRFSYSVETAFKTNLFTRLTCGILYGLSLIPLVIIGSPVTVAVAVVVVAASTVLWSCYVKGMGIIGVLNWEELLIGAGVGWGAFIATLF